MTSEDFRYAGLLISEKFTWSDDELALLLKVNAMMIANLKARGMDWDLARRPLVKEREELERYSDARKRK